MIVDIELVPTGDEVDQCWQYYCRYFDVVEAGDEPRLVLIPGEEAFGFLTSIFVREQLLLEKEARERRLNEEAMEYWAKDSLELLGVIDDLPF